MQGTLFILRRKDIAGMDKLQVFLCYARQDESLCDELDKHLKGLERNGMIDVWYDRKISVGTPWEIEIDRRLKAAQIVLLLVSPDFMSSEYCYSIEMQWAVQRHKLGETYVIPVILRPVHWQFAPFGHLQALPQNAVPVTEWRSLDQAFLTVVEEVRKVVMRLASRPETISPGVSDPPTSAPIQPGYPPGGSGDLPGWSFLMRVVLILSVILLSTIGVGLLYLSHLNQVSAAATATVVYATSQANQHATSTASANATSTASANATATAQVSAYPSYLSGHGTLAFVDPLHQENGSQWPPFQNSEGGACQFSAGAYHVSQLPTNYYNWCHPNEAFNNFAFEVQLTITEGACGGMIFREQGDGLNLYYYAICADGAFGVLKYFSHGSATTLQANGSSAIHAGQGQQNTIAVVANGSTLTFYVNEQEIAQVQDSSYTSGEIGLLADPRDSGQVTDVAYIKARVWTL
jgi:hypothetical protein